jgi:hypothetical protein
MSIKEYLSQAYHVDQRINSKIEQITSLRALATKANSTITDMPKNATRNFHKMEENVAKMIDLEFEMNEDITNLLDLKQDIFGIIKKLSNPEHKTILELRYLGFKQWEQIAETLGYNLRYLYKLHNDALRACIPILEKLDTKNAQKTLVNTIGI